MKDPETLRFIKSPYLLMVLAMLCWSGNWLLTRYMRVSVTPLGLNFWRWTLALAILLPFTAADTWRHRAVVLREWRILAVLSLLGVALYQPLVYLALMHTTAINAALFNSTAPMVIVAMSWGLFRERITLRQGVGIAISLVGVVALVTHGELRQLLALRFNPGDLWALVSIPVWCLYTVLLKRRPPDLPPLAFLTVSSLFGALMMAPVFLWLEATGGGMPLTPESLITIVYVALFASVTAFIFWNSAVLQVGANKAGLFLHLHPAFTTVLAILFLGELLMAYHMVGILLIAAGIYLTTISPSVQVRDEDAVESQG